VAWKLLAPVDWNRRFAATQELVQNPDVPAIFEGTFEHGGVFVKADISATSPRKTAGVLLKWKSTSDLKDEHLEDVAIQSHVLSHAGLDLASVWLAHIDRSYVLALATVDPRRSSCCENSHPQVQEPPT